MKDEFRGVFIGRDTIFIGDFSSDGNNLSVPKKNNYIPLLSKETIIHSNAKSMLKDYEEKSLIDLDNGRTEDKVRVYFFDIDTCDKFERNYNGSIMRELEMLRNEKSYLYQKIRQLENLLMITGNNSLVKDMVKLDYDFYTEQLKPSFGMFTKKNDKGGKK